MPVTVTGLLVGGMPMSSPRWVPWLVHRTATVSASAISSPIVKRRSAKAVNLTLPAVHCSINDAKDRARHRGAKQVSGAARSQNGEWAGSVVMARRAKRIIVRSLGVLLAAAVLGAVLFGVHGHARSAHAQQVDLNRAAVVQQLFDTRNQGDVEGALSTLVPNVTFLGPAPCGPTITPCQGTAAVRPLFQQQVATHAVLTLTSIQVHGSLVTGTIEIRADDITAVAGVERIAQGFLAQIPGKQIAAWYGQVDFADPQTLQFVCQNVVPAPPVCSSRP